MIKVMIVDDEKNTRESIKKHILWDKLGVDEVRTAKNGLDALELANSFPPDIILCDVRMPRMDGIELATNIRQKFPACKIIFLSGFADKEYLKSAIHLKALEYIEKPLDIEEINIAIKNAISLINEERKKENEQLQVKEKLMHSTPLLNSEFTLSLISSDMSMVNSSIGKFSRIIDFPLEGLFTCISVILNWAPSASEESKLTKRSLILQNLAQMAEYNSIKLIVGIRPENDEIIIILAYRNKNALTETRTIVQDIFDKLIDLSDNTFTHCIGIGTPVQCVSDIHISYNKAVEANKLSFYNGYSKIYEYTSPMNKDFQLNDDFHGNFQNILEKSPDQAEVIVKNLTNEFIVKKIDPEIAKSIFYSLILDAMNISEKMLLLDDSVKTKIPEIFNKLSRNKTIRELSNAVIENIKSMLFASEYTGTSNRKILEAMHFIKKNYSDPSLTIQMIADATNLNKNYLCTLFKKLVGKTLNDYINEIRVEKAKQYLMDSSIKMYEVAQLSGFSDPNYFSTIFKKYTGCTPSQFRNGNKNTNC